MSRASLYAEIAALTAPLCRQCSQPFACCTSRGCELAAAHTASTEGIAADGGDHPSLRYMGPAGCLLEAHRRPACATWCCAMVSAAGRRAHPEQRREYQRLRAAIALAEARA